MFKKFILASVAIGAAAYGVAKGKDAWEHYQYMETIKEVRLSYDEFIGLIEPVREECTKLADSHSSLFEGELIEESKCQSFFAIAGQLGETASKLQGLETDK